MINIFPSRIRSSLISMKFLCTLLRHQFREGPIGGILQNVSCFLGLQNYKYSGADKIIITINYKLGSKKKGLSDAHFHVTFSTAFIKIAGKSLITTSSQSNSQWNLCISWRRLSNFRVHKFLKSTVNKGTKLSSINPSSPNIYLQILQTFLSLYISLKN